MLKTFARSKTKSQRMHDVDAGQLSGYLCKMPKWHQDTKASKEEHYDKDKLTRAKTKNQRMHAYIWTAMCAWWSCSWRMRDCFCTAQVSSSPSVKLLADLKARKTRKAGKQARDAENNRNVRECKESYVRMVRHDARPAPGSLSGYQLYNMHNWTQGAWKARIKAGRLRQAYETENNRKSENARICAYVQWTVMCAWSGRIYATAFVLWVSLASDLCKMANWSQGAHEKQGRQEEKSSFPEKNIIKVIHKQDSKASN